MLCSSPAKKQVLMALIKEMQKKMLAGDGDKSMKVEDAMAEAEDEMGGEESEEEDEMMAEGDDEEVDYRKSFMNDRKRAPIKSMRIIAMASKKPKMKEMKRG